MAELVFSLEFGVDRIQIREPLRRASRGRPGLALRFLDFPPVLLQASQAQNWPLKDHPGVLRFHGQGKGLLFEMNWLEIRKRALHTPCFLILCETRARAAEPDGNALVLASCCLDLGAALAKAAAAGAGVSDAMTRATAELTAIDGGDHIATVEYGLRLTCVREPLPAPVSAASGGPPRMPTRSQELARTLRRAASPAESERSRASSENAVEEPAKPPVLPLPMQDACGGDFAPARFASWHAGHDASEVLASDISAMSAPDMQRAPLPRPQAHESRRAEGAFFPQPWFVTKHRARCPAPAPNEAQRAEAAAPAEASEGTRQHEPTGPIFVEALPEGSPAYDADFQQQPADATAGLEARLHTSGRDTPATAASPNLALATASSDSASGTAASPEVAPAIAASPLVQGPAASLAIASPLHTPGVPSRSPPVRANMATPLPRPSETPGRSSLLSYRQSSAGTPHPPVEEALPLVSEMCRQLYQDISPSPVRFMDGSPLKLGFSPSF